MLSSASAAPELKKKYRKIDLEVKVEVFGLSKEDIKKAIEVEAAWANEDKVIRETADKRNELESYIYAMRTKLESTLRNYYTSNENSALATKLNEAEDWLYGDGFDSTKSNYARKIDELKALGNMISLNLSIFLY